MRQEVVGTQTSAHPLDLDCPCPQSASVPDMRRRNFVTAAVCGGLLYASRSAWGSPPVWAISGLIRKAVVYFRTPRGVAVLRLVLRSAKEIVEWSMRIRNQSDERVEDDVKWSAHWVDNGVAVAKPLGKGRVPIALSPKTEVCYPLMLPSSLSSVDHCAASPRWRSSVAEVDIYSVAQTRTR